MPAQIHLTSGKVICCMEAAGDVLAAMERSSDSIVSVHATSRGSVDHVHVVSRHVCAVTED